MAETAIGSTLKVIATGGALALVTSAQSIKANDGGSSTFETGGLNDVVNGRTPTGVVEPGTLSFQYYKDPADTIHKLLQASANNGVSLDVEVLISDSGETKTGTGTIVKHDMGVEKKNGWLVDVEIELFSIWTVTEAS